MYIQEISIEIKTKVNKNELVGEFNKKNNCMVL